MLVLAAALLLSTAALAGCLDGGGPAEPDGGTDDGSDDGDGPGDGDGGTPVPEQGSTATDGLPPVQTTVRVKQDPGKTVYWVTPGQRTLDTRVFGNASQPRETGAWEAEAAPPPVESNDLFEDLPFLVGAPGDVRQTRDDGGQVYAAPTPFSDDGRIVDGALDITYQDRVPYDVGKPHDARDSATLAINFTDPEGNRYVIHLKELLQPPIPGDETGGGVVTSNFLHGLTGTGTPLMPTEFNYGALWGQADLYVNGELAQEDHVAHFMTTQTVRNQTYGLAHDGDLPLKPEETIAGQIHQTHGFFTPIKVTSSGPQFEPVDTNFTLPNGQDQPFIHVMFEEDEIVEGPFADWEYPEQNELPTQQVDDITSPPVQTEVHVSQEPGNTTYWVTPGPRELSPQVFGTDGNERFTGQWQTEQAPPPFENDILAKNPFMVGAPVDARQTQDDGTQVYAEPTPFGDEGVPVNGSFDLRYQDRVPYDIGKPHDAVDTTELSATFRDPQGTKYRIEIKDQLLQPPIPGYETGNGVVTSSWLHGQTHTGTPLMPKVFNYGAFWGEGDLYANDTKVEENHVVHFMTTQQVRKSDYSLAFDEELPLRPSETISNQVHHTHGFFTPIQVNPDGPPEHDPVDTNYTLPDGKEQPFVHVMFEEDTIESGPFQDWTFGAGPDDGSDDGGTVDVDRVVHVNGTEYDFTPTNVTVEKGETVKVVFTNTGNIAHNWGVDAFDVRTETIQGGESDSVTFTADETGTFAFYCSVAGHREQGMEGHVHSEDSG